MNEAVAAWKEKLPSSDGQLFSSIPGMRASIKKGMQEPLESNAKQLDW